MSVTELAEYLAVSARTVYRALDRWSALGLPVRKVEGRSVIDLAEFQEWLLGALEQNNHGASVLESLAGASTTRRKGR